MCNWFKKLFGCKHEGGNCGNCCKKEEIKPVSSETKTEIKPEVSQTENAEKSQ